MRLLTLRYKTYPNSLRAIAPGGKHHFTFISPSFYRRHHGLGRWPGSTGRQIGGGGVFTVFSERKAAAPREFLLSPDESSVEPRPKLMPTAFIRLPQRRLSPSSFRVLQDF